MIGLKINAAKAQFFDRPKVQRAVDRSTRRLFVRMGGLTRKIARQSIRKRKKPSPAGQPPHSHLGLLRKFIYFVFESKPRPTMVAGPALLNGRPDPQPVNATVPEALEHGAKLRVRGRFQRSAKIVDLEPRPYMAPAFNKAKDKLPGLWRDSVT